MHLSAGPVLFALVYRIQPRFTTAPANRDTYLRQITGRIAKLHAQITQLAAQTHIVLAAIPYALAFQDRLHRLMMERTAIQFQVR